MSTRNRLNLEGPCLIFVTTTVNGRFPAFNDQPLAETAVSQFREALEHYTASCVAYVLMPSHLHALLGFGSYQSVSRFMQSYKILTSKRIRALARPRLQRLFQKDGAFRFWAPRYDELVIASEQQFRVKLEYIHNNPVRAGLANRATEWPHSSAGDWEAGEQGLIPIDKDFMYLA